METSLSLHAELSKRGWRVAAIDQVFAEAPVGLMVFHGVEGCIYANHHVLHLFGSAWEHLRGFGWARAVDREDARRVRAALEAFDYDDTKEVVVRFRVLSKGQSRVLQMAIRSVEGGAERCPVATLIDVTDVHAGEQERDLASREAFRLAHAPHLVTEVRNAVQAVFAVTEVMEEETLSGRALEALGALKASADRARTIADSLASTDEAVVSVDRALRSHALWFGQVLGPSCSFELDLQAGDQPVAWTNEELHHVVLQLLVNLRDVAPNGDRIRLRSRTNGHVAVLRGRLSGVGRPLSEVFAPLLHLDRPGGAFVTTQRLLRSIGARIRLPDSTSVELVVPLMDQGSTPAVAPQRPARILLVDDHPAVRASLAQSLAMQGHEVFSASGVFEALERLTESEVDLIVTDVVLPDGSGTTVHDAAAREARPPQVLYISGYGQDELPMLDGRLDEHTRLLQKPFRPSQLIEAIAALQGVRTA